MKEKYVGPSNNDRVKSLVKAIQNARGTQIAVTFMKNSTIQFVITGGRKGVKRALEDVKYEFEKVS